MIKYKTIKPEARIVVTIANSLFLSLIIPNIPYTKAAGKEISESNPPRVTIGLPQPGLRKTSIEIIIMPRPSMLADFFPYFIVLTSLPKN